MRLKRLPDEDCYGFQVATKTIAEGVAASKLAKEAGARWMDINCGCPIYGKGVGVECGICAGTGCWSPGVGGWADESGWGCSCLVNTAHVWHTGCWPSLGNCVLESPLQSLLLDDTERKCRFGDGCTGR